MSNQALETFFELLPSIQDFIPHDGPIVFLRAEWAPELSRLPIERVQAYQTFRPLAKLLENRRLTLVSALPATAKLALLIPTKQKKESLYLMARACQMLEDGAVMILVCENHRGARSYRDAMEKLFSTIEYSSKNKCLLVWSKKSAGVNSEVLAQYLKDGEQFTIGGTNLVSRSGVFSWDEIDSGSKLLAESIPTSLKGSGADFGAGTGYLSQYAIEHCPEITTLSLFEAESIALDCAKKNLANIAGNRVKTDFIWCDLTTEAPKANFDFILMNPPCHDSRELDVEIGKKFISAAKNSLKSGGALYMVGNAHISYREILNKNFGKVETICKTRTFITYVAVK